MPPVLCLTPTVITTVGTGQSPCIEIRIMPRFPEFTIRLGADRINGLLYMADGSRMGIFRYQRYAEKNYEKG
jgi:hypothetical protein